MSYTIPGKAKGDPRVNIEDAEDKDLNYWAGRMQKDLAADPNGQYAPRNRETLEAIGQELERRGMSSDAPPSERANAAPAPRAQQRSTALAKVGDGGLIKTAEQAMAKIKELQGSCHLVNSPAVGCGIPDGCAVAWSVTYLDVDRDTYPIKGDSNKVGVGKDALNMISMGMGVQWDPCLSKRLDDCSDPHYCRYLAVGKMRDSDGTWITIFDEKENDLRDGSPQAKEMSEKQLAQQRTNIYSLTITKARNRAIRGRGVKTSYPKTELQQPFVAFKLVFTGESSDPEIRRMKARSMVESTQLLFGAPSQHMPGLPPPPVDTTGHYVDDDEMGPDGVGQDQY